MKHLSLREQMRAHLNELADQYGVEIETWDALPDTTARLQTGTRRLNAA